MSNIVSVLSELDNGIDTVEIIPYDVKSSDNEDTLRAVADEWKGPKVEFSSVSNEEYDNVYNLIKPILCSPKIDKCSKESINAIYWQLEKYALKSRIMDLEAKVKDTELRLNEEKIIRRNCEKEFEEKLEEECLEIEENKEYEKRLYKEEEEHKFTKRKLMRSIRENELLKEDNDRLKFELEKACDIIRRDNDRLNRLGLK